MEQLQSTSVERLGMLSMILASNGHEDRIWENTHNCDEQHLEYWCIAHVQVTRARCAKIESHNITISDFPQFPSLF